MSDLHVRPVSSGKDLRRFIGFPYDLYKDSPFWVAPIRMDQARLLNPKKNAFFGHGTIQPFIAEDQNGRTLGRIAGIINGNHLDKYQDGNGFFGFFETVERYDVAKALLDQVVEWLRSKDMQGVRGPTNPSMNDVAGLLVDGFDRYPTVMMPYNHPYYEEYLTRYGFTRAMTMWAYTVDSETIALERLKRGAQLLYKRYPGLKLRPLDMSRFLDEARTILALYNDAWSENWGHVSMTEAEFTQLANEMKQIVEPELVHILELDGQPVAFQITLPDVNVALRHVRNGRLFPTGLLKILYHAKIKKTHRCRTLLMGVQKKFRGRGIDFLLVLAIVENGLRIGYTWNEMSWVLESNKPMLTAAQAYGGEPDKEFAMLEMRFDEAASATPSPPDEQGPATD